MRDRFRGMPGPFRTGNIQMDVIFAEGVPEGYRATAAAAKLPF